jgi:hypothetical protein
MIDQLYAISFKVPTMMKAVQTEYIPGSTVAFAKEVFKRIMIEQNEPIYQIVRITVYQKVEVIHS